MISVLLVLLTSTVHATDLSAALAQSDADRADAVAAVADALATSTDHVHAPFSNNTNRDGVAVANR